MRHRYLLIVISIFAGGMTVFGQTRPSAPTWFQEYKVCKPTGTPTVSVTVRSSAINTGGTAVRWYKQATGGALFTVGDAVTETVSSTTIYYAAAYSATAGESLTRTAVTATVLNPPTTTPTVTGNVIIGAGRPMTLIGQGAPQDFTYEWFTPPNTQLATGQYYPTSPAQTTANFASVRFTAPYCYGPATSFTVTVYPFPAIQGSVIASNGKAMLSCNADYDSYAWFNTQNPSVILKSSTSASDNTFAAAEHGAYQVRVAKAGVTAISEVYRVGTQSEPQNLNQVLTQTIQVAGITSPDAAANLDKNSKILSTAYFDELGRPVQTVITQGSPLGLDVVQPLVYDKYGREDRKYLPTVTVTTDGWYKPNIINDNGDYAGIAATNPYNNGESDKVSDDAKPYALTRFEPSPLRRISQQGAPGTVWQPNMSGTYADPVVSDHSIKKSYEANEANEVLLWNYTPSTTYPLGLVNTGTGAAPAYYGANQLARHRTKDEHQNEVIEYLDKDGRTLLKRVQTVAGSFSLTDADKDTHYASTYYIYDDFGNLACVIPPEATSRLATEYHHAAATDFTKDDFLARWAFRYTYDGRQRMTIKQVPGVAPLYMIYDYRDRLVMTQDGNQRKNRLWLFTKYDALDRVIMTGVIKWRSGGTPESIQQDMVNVYGLYSAWGENYVGAASGNVHGYTNVSFPLTDTLQNYLSVTYFDTYSFRAGWSGNYNYVNDGLSQVVGTKTYSQPGSENTKIVGLVTGTKVKVLDGGAAGGYTWLKAVVYYDNKYRVVQTKSDNYKGGIDRVSSLYDFTGKVLKSRLLHATYDVDWVAATGANVVGNKLIKTAATQAWGLAGAASYEILPAGQDGWLEVTVSEITTSRMIGLADTNPDLNYAAINYAFYLNGATLSVQEKGVLKNTFPGTLKPGDLVRIERAGTTITYRWGANTYVSTAPSTTALMVDASFYTTGGTLIGAQTSFSKTEKTIGHRNVYDHAGRITEVWHVIEGQVNEKRVVANEYNELGQLVTKKLHTSGQTGVASQVVDYRYNIRGWLTSINDAALTQDGANPRDFFGMELGYDKPFTTINDQPSDKLYFNGNISAVKWSNTLGQGPISQNAYVYGYDAMNRLGAATFKERTVDWSTPANSAFVESGFTYDLNGNIKTLIRNDRRSSGLMDVLTYDYGTGNSQSNKLLKVTDGGDDFSGFIDGANTGDDYTYDANGSMVTDQNKGITTSMTYNFLNLPELIIKGTSTLRYIYDATGRKLAQQASYGSTSKTTDYVGEIQYENDVMRFIQHDEGRVVLTEETKVAASDGTSLGSLTTESGGTVATVTQNGGQSYIEVTSNGTALGALSLSGIISPVTSGTRYRVRVKGYYTGTSPVYIKARTNQGNINWGNQWHGASLPSTVQNETWVEETIIVPAGATQLEILAAWPTSTSGEKFYVNEVEISQVALQASPEYQYNLKDHLGNVRLTFTTKEDVYSAVASLETANAPNERTAFLYYDEAVMVNSYLFDHTNNRTIVVPPGQPGQPPDADFPFGTVAGYATRLTGGTTGEKFGLTKTLSVMPGDVVTMEVFAKYLHPQNAEWTEDLAAFIASLAVGGGAPAGTLVDGGAAGSIGSGAFPITPMDHSGEGGDGPKAYLNYILFNRDFSAVLDMGFKRISIDAIEDGWDVDHDRLAFDGEEKILITEPGYMYIYLSNENETPVEVFFDDFEVVHTKSPVVQSDDYYPFGLTFNSYVRENAVAQNLKFNGIEHDDELDLGVNASFFRIHDPILGRWWQIDPKPHEGYTPYSTMGNNPILYGDPLGDTTRIYSIQGKLLTTINDSHKNQAHFFNTRGYSKMAQSRGGKESDDDFAARVRENSVAFLGDNSINDLQKIVKESNKAGLEIAFVGSISGSREIRFSGLPIDENNGAGHVDLITQMDKNYSNEEQESLFMFGHVHPIQRAQFEAKKQWEESLGTLTNPSDYKSVLNDRNGNRRLTPIMIGTSYGYTMTPSIPRGTFEPVSVENDSREKYRFYKKSKVK